MKWLRRYVVAGAVALAGAASAPAAASADEIRLVVDISDRKLRVMDGEEVVRVYRVAVGKPAHPTPKGEFRIRRIIWNPRWVPPNEKWARNRKPRKPGDPRNPMGRVKMFFQEPDYYIHGTSDRSSLGKAASHGCIRMANSDVIDLAKLVMRHGGEQRESSWYQRVLSRASQSQRVHLSKPVRFVVRK